MTGFDSEADRRDAVRMQIIDRAVQEVMNMISAHSVTATAEERRFLEVSIAMRILKGQELEARSAMYRREIREAEKRVDA